MKRFPTFRVAALALGCVLAASSLSVRVWPQAEQSATVQLLGRAHTLEVRGRMDMAKQLWQQVLLVDPKNTDALAGLARAAKLEGHGDEAAKYESQIRAINPNDPNLQRLQNLASGQDTGSQLQEAGRLAQAGQYAQAMAILRGIYGTNPPAGDAALAYYQTEAATEDGRPQAVAGLRALMDKYPQDSRYQIALGKILTYSPRTRAEGRKLLARHPADPDAQEALRQSLIWDAQNPSSAGDIRAYLSHHPDQQLQGAVEQEHAQRRVVASTPSVAAVRPSAPAQTAEQRAATQVASERSSEEREGYAALNAHRPADAETHFKAVLDKTPQSRQALAGMGYVRMQQSNFGGAVSYFEQAQQSGQHDAAMDKAIADSRFYYTMQTATAALNQNDLKTAQQQFDAALRMRPNDATALEGLGGTLLKGQQAEAALPVYGSLTRVAPENKAGWRGLMMAQYGANRYAEALVTDGRVPVKVHGDLMRDPDYLRTLASAYLALGRDADAQRVLQTALAQPFPVGARGLKADVEMQYAALLATAGRYDQAAGLYRQVLAGDSTNTNAWVGLVQTLHAQSKDAETFQVIQSMPASNYTGALEEPGFVTTVAAVYEAQNHDDLAIRLLEAFLAKQQLESKKPFVPAEVELAGLYLKHGDAGRAFPLYQAMIAATPRSVDAWRGLLSALHETKRDAEAVAQLQQLPEATRRDLERDPAYLETVAGIYASVGQPQTAQAFLDRAEEHYAQMHSQAPSSLAIQTAWIQFNAGDDAGLYRSLMTMGTRTDLSTEQRLTVEQIWTQWAVRRANAASARGDYRRAIAILNAAARAFPNNPAVLRALATGYAGAGMPKEAVAIFRSQDLTHASAEDYKAAAGAALAANDLAAAEMWLRFGLEQYPQDPQMLVLAGKFEAQRGDPNRAKLYYSAALKLMPAGNPGMELAGELHQPMPAMTRPTANGEPQDLATLLGQPDGMPAAGRAQPYLPSYTGGTGGAYGAYGGAPVPLNNTIPGNYNAPGRGSTALPPAGTSTLPGTQPTYGPSNGTTQQLKDYMPPRSQAMEPAIPGGVRFVIEGPAEEQVDTRGARQVESLAASGASGVRLTVARFVPRQQGQTQDGTPIVNYAPVARGAAQTTQPPSGSAVQIEAPAYADPDEAAAAKRAAAIKANQSSGSSEVRGVSHPPQENYDVPMVQPTAKVSGAQYTPGQGSQGLPVQSANPQAAGGFEQQYPQPGTSSTAAPSSTPAIPRRRVRRSTGKAMPVQPTPAPDVQPAAAPEQPQMPAMNYPPASAPGSAPVYAPAEQGLPRVGPPVTLGQPPSDYELQMQQVPTLRGYYDPRIDPTAPLTPRQQTEFDLASIEGSTSPWVGGSVIGRYRSGTPGIDRLASLSAPFEYSFTAANSVRFTFVGMPVFLNSGQLNTNGGTLTPYTPLLGTLYGSATNNPALQNAVGVGGEVQIATNTFAAAGGVTPYQFLVTNVIGRGRWRPANGHFTFFGGRDPVQETQLSYAGLHDPASASLTYAGNIWGGVVQTGGGARFDAGGQKSGIYAVVEGGYLSGYHVLNNTKYDGTFGAYFNVKNWPEYGSLNVGGVFYGMHFANNERAETYGLGGYFSPNAYFLAGVPVSFRGHSGVNLHYAINGSVGVQSFTESSQAYFPLDPVLQTQGITLCQTYTGSTIAVINRSCGYQPNNASTGLNFSIDAEVAYHMTDHWFAGGFFSANNTNNYNTVQGGFFVRYLFRPQVETTESPTGLFPVEGLRPLRVP